MIGLLTYLVIKIFGNWGTEIMTKDHLYFLLQAQLYIYMLNDTLSCPISHHISCIRTRFRLLHLGLSVLQSVSAIPPIVKNVLRERIYHLALDYFSVTPQWGTQCVTVLAEDIRVLIQFWDAMKVDKKGNFLFSH